jgi:flagellar biosynthesis protein
LSNPTDEKEKRQSAVALQYEANRDRAPEVIAKGRGHIARRIIEEAKVHGIPVQEDPLLVEALMGLDFHQEIPSELFQVVAEIYVFLHGLRKKAGSSS